MGCLLEFEATVQILERFEYLMREYLSEKPFGEFFIISKLKTLFLEEPDAVSRLYELTNDSITVVEIGIQLLLSEANSA